MELHWSEIFENVIRMGFAFILSIPIALNREVKSHSAGLRTYPLVSIGATAFILTGTSNLSGDESIARVLYGVITGMGFIGGGAILKEKDRVKGTANAASLWCTGAIGVFVALNRLEIALTLSLVVFLVFALKPKFRART